jgi:beta-xylosidase
VRYIGTVGITRYQDDGKFVLYFAGSLVGSHGQIHCAGTALSNNVLGPYSPSTQILACPGGEGGAIDPDGFRDVDGTHYVTYKIDGNARGSGGLCNNGNYPRRSTPLMLQKVAHDGISPLGMPMQILDRDDNDGPLIEAPSLARVGNKYYLFFSSNCYSTPWYDTSFAVADSIRGPYTKRGPLFLSGDLGGLVAPGGADVSPDGAFIALHAGEVGSRFMHTARLSFENGFITACTGAGHCRRAS